jgi:cyclopropane-fatty-acyl-phospholipid synthase
MLKRTPLSQVGLSQVGLSQVGLSQVTLSTKPPKLPLLMRSVAHILKSNWRAGELELELPSGETMVFKGAEDGPKALMQIRDFKFMRRIFAQGDIGFFDGYRAGEWDSPDLHTLLEVFCLNLDEIERLQNGNEFMRFIHQVMHRLRPNSKAGAKRNIFAHYDLGNDFYGQWLDKTMTYSSALFDENGDLEAAQVRKYAELAKLVDLKAGQTVLEIGCGWGGFAQYAAQTLGAQVTCLTISQAQYDFAVERMQTLGLADMVTILLMDYRDIEGQFDCVVSIEMFEAVGEIYWDTYFDKVKSVLKPGGKAGLQIITIRDDLFDYYRTRTDFIQKYVFPGGMLPSPKKLKEQAKRTGFSLHTARSFGADYTRTLKQWTQRFEAAWHEGRITGFDAAFRRLWLFYLAYCAAGFQTQRTDVVHLKLVKA